MAFFANYYEFGWVLERFQRELLLRLTPTDFGDDRGAWAINLALGHALEGNAAQARELAGGAVEEFRGQLADAPEDGQRHALLGFALALAGRKADAIREGVRGTELLPVEKGAYFGAYNRHLLARIYILAGGDPPEKALDTLEQLLKMPYFLTKAWLRIDPTF